MRTLEQAAVSSGGWKRGTARWAPGTGHWAMGTRIDEIGYKVKGELQE